MFPNFAVIPKRSNPSLNYVDVQEYGAIGDGATDDASAIQSALNSEINVKFTLEHLIKSELVVPSNRNILIEIGASIKVGATYSAPNQFFVTGRDRISLFFVSGSNVSIDCRGELWPNQDLFSGSDKFINAITIHETSNVKVLKAITRKAFNSVMGLGSNYSTIQNITALSSPIGNENYNCAVDLQWCLNNLIDTIYADTYEETVDLNGGTEDTIVNNISGRFIAQAILEINNAKRTSGSNFSGIGTTPIIRLFNYPVPSGAPPYDYSYNNEDVVLNNIQNYGNYSNTNVISGPVQLGSS